MEKKINMTLQDELYKKLPNDKIQIKWNKNLIPMEKFLSFLTVETERSYDHLGSSTGWTLLKNDSIGLQIGGGIVEGVEYLDRLQYGKKLQNPYNNYVNPFYLFDILTDEGKDFFVKYYEDEIEKILSGSDSTIKHLKNRLVYEENLYDNLKVEINTIRQIKPSTP